MLEREHLLVKDFPVQFLAARIDRESRPQSQANVSFEETIRKIGKLIALSRRVKAGRVSEDSESASPARTHSQSGIQNPQSASWKSSQYAR